MDSVAYPKLYLYRRIVQAKLFIDKNFHQPINLDSIADGAAFSKFHFLRLFKQTYGKSPHQYLTWVRIEQAKLLLSSGKSVTEVCFAIGFDSISSFTGLFKKLVKTTPSHYQHQQQVRAAEISRVPLKFIPNCFAEQKGWTQKSNFREAR